MASAAFAGGGIQEEALFLEDNISSNFGSVGTTQVQPTVVRKDFPETWIWDDLNEEG